MESHAVPHADSHTKVTKRPLNTWEVTAISVGFMGPVMAMSLNGIGVAGLVGKAVPFTFLVSFVGSLFVAYAFVRLLRTVTHAGSVYALAGVTLGPKAGFFGGFALLGTYIFMTACILGACAVFFEAMLEQFNTAELGLAWLIIPIAVAVIGAILNLRNSQLTARTTLFIGLAGIVVMLVLSVIILVSVTGDNAPVSTGLDWEALSPAGNPWSAIMTASVFGFLSWAGFESGSSLGEETNQPQRIIPRSLLLAVVVGGFVYTFVMFAQSLGFGTDEEGIAAFASASSTLTTLGSTYVGSWFAVLLSIIAFAVAFGAFLSSSTATSRLLFALARDGFGPAKFAERHPSSGVPVPAVLFTNGLSIVMIVVLGICHVSPVDVYYWYATIATLCMVVAYGMASAGAIAHILRRGNRVPLWEIIIPVLALAYLAFVYVVQVSGQEAPYNYFPWISGAWCVIGAIVIQARPELARKIGRRWSRADDASTH